MPVPRMSPMMKSKSSHGPMTRASDGSGEPEDAEDVSRLSAASSIALPSTGKCECDRCGQRTSTPDRCVMPLRNLPQRLAQRLGLTALLDEIAERLLGQVV